MIEEITIKFGTELKPTQYSWKSQLYISYLRIIWATFLCEITIVHLGLQLFQDQCTSYHSRIYFMLHNLNVTDELLFFRESGEWGLFHVYLLTNFSKMVENLSKIFRAIEKPHQSLQNSIRVQFHTFMIQLPK